MDMEMYHMCVCACSVSRYAHAVMNVPRSKHHTKHSIERQVGVDQEEEIAPIPRKVLDNSVGIGFGPQGEGAQTNTSLRYQ
jgi:hypothetical protein